MHKQEERAKKVILKYSHFVLKAGIPEQKIGRAGIKATKTVKGKKNTNANFMAKGPFLERTDNFSDPKVIPSS